MTTFEIAQQIAELMPRIARRILLEFFQKVDISQSQLFTIMALYDRDGGRISDLSKVLGISAPTVSGLIDRLEKAAYVKREINQQDRRVIHVYLLSKGKKIAQTFRRVVTKQWEFELSKISSTDQIKLLQILKDIQEKKSC